MYITSREHFYSLTLAEFDISLKFDSILFSYILEKLGLQQRSTTINFIVKSIELQKPKYKVLVPCKIRANNKQCFSNINRIDILPKIDVCLQYVKFLFLVNLILLLINLFQIIVKASQILQIFFSISEVMFPYKSTFENDDINEKWQLLNISFENSFSKFNR